MLVFSTKKCCQHSRFDVNGILVSHRLRFRIVSEFAFYRLFLSCGLIDIFHTTFIYFEHILDLCWSVYQLYLNDLNLSTFPLSVIVKGKGSLTTVNYPKLYSYPSSFFVMNGYLCS